MDVSFDFSKSIQSALSKAPSNPYLFQKWVKFCLAYIEYVCPSEMELETGRLIKLLAAHPMGLSRNELLENFYEKYLKVSANQKESLKICLEKVIQRARIAFKKYNLTISYCASSKKYFINQNF